MKRRLLLLILVLVVSLIFVLLQLTIGNSNHHRAAVLKYYASLHDSSAADSAFNLTDGWLHQCAHDLRELPPFSPSLPKYSLGDCIKLCRCDRYKLRKSTIMSQYRALACPESNPNHVKFGNLTAVQEIFDRLKGQSGFKVPPNDALVVHLRLGDVMEGSKQDVNTLLTQGGNPAHGGSFKNSIRSVYQFLQEIKAFNGTKIELIGGSHVREAAQKSRVYAGCLYNSLTHSGYQVSLRTDFAGPDQDFYYLCHAKHIMVSTGGYSRLIGKYVQQHGGTVVGQTW